MNIDSDYQQPSTQPMKSLEAPESISYITTPKQSSSNPFSYEAEADCLLKQEPSSSLNILDEKPEAQQASEDPDKTSTEDSGNRRLDDTEEADRNLALRLQAELNGWTGDLYALNTFSAVNSNVEGVSEEARLFNLALPEAKVYLKQVTGLFIAMIITSICALMPSNSEGYLAFVLFPPLLYCFAWIVLEVRWKANVLGDLWLEHGNLFHTFDITNVMILALVMQLKSTGIVSTCVYSALFFYSVAHVYVYSSKGLLWKRWPDILARYYYGTQVMWMTLNIDGFIDNSWSMVFSISYIFLAIKISAYLKSMFNLLRKIIRTSSLDVPTRSLGFLWQLGYQGLIIVPLMAIYGFTQYQGPEKDFSMIKKVAIGTMIVNAMLLATTLMRKEHILNFIVKMGLFDSQLLEYERNQRNILNNVEVNEISFEMKKKEEYFVMLSSTYFRPLSESPYAKIKDIVLRNKTKLFKSTANTNKSKLISQDDDIEQLKHDIKVLRNVDDLEGGCGNKFQTSIPEDRSCYVCCLNPSNVVLMGCGHGGICYGCAVSLIKKKNECMECRKQVDGIFKIQQSSKVFEIVKGYELHKVCK